MINMVLPLFLFLLVVLAPTAATATATADSTDQNALVSFDYMLLVLTWPPSYCVIQKDLNDPCKDINHVPKDFTIHGLWPNLLRGVIDPDTYPGCSRDKLVVIKDLDPNIIRQAIQDWPDIKKNFQGTTKQIFSGFFWEKEWEKHGVCSNLNPNGYMDLTLTRYHYLLPLIMKAQKQLPYPRSTVNFEEFTNKITAEAPVKPRLVCKNLTQPPYSQYLVEIQFNMTNYSPYNLQNVDVQQTSNCVSSIPVNFPQ